MNGILDTAKAGFRNRKVIVASVGTGPFANRGNVLIERSTHTLLGLPSSTPKFSVFEPINNDLLALINSHDVLVVTGCTTLQDDHGHQRCFDKQFGKIEIPKVCFAGAFYCEPDERPSLRIAKMYDTVIGARDPWTALYLARNGIACELIGCPTLLDQPEIDSWRWDDNGDVIVSSTPVIKDLPPKDDGNPRRYLAHDESSPGEDLLAPDAFDKARMVVTSRLHAALPAIARGIPVRFYDPRGWGVDYAGSVRFSLLAYLGIPLDGSTPPAYPADKIRSLKKSSTDWLADVVRTVDHRHGTSVNGSTTSVVQMQLE